MNTYPTCIVFLSADIFWLSVDDNDLLILKVPKHCVGDRVTICIV